MYGIATHTVLCNGWHSHTRRQTGRGQENLPSVYLTATGTPTPGQRHTAAVFYAGRGVLCRPWRHLDWPAAKSLADPRRQRSARLARQHSERIGTSISVTLPNRASSAERSLAFAAARSASLAVMIPL